MAPTAIAAAEAAAMSIQKGREPGDRSELWLVEDPLPDPDSVPPLPDPDPLPPLPPPLLPPAGSNWEMVQLDERRKKASCLKYG